MSMADLPGDHELVVAEDGTIPADQLARLGVGPGEHLRVVRGERAGEAERLGGSMPELPEVSWEDFERASQAGQSDFERL